MTRSIKKGKHDSAKAQSAAYSTQARFIKNRRRKLEKHVAKFPNDAQASDALRNINTAYKQRPGSAGFKEASVGYQVVRTEKRKNRQGKDIEVPIYRNVDKTVTGVSAPRGSFYSIKERANISDDFKAWFNV